MGESLMKQCHVEVEGLQVVNFFSNNIVREQNPNLIKLQPSLLTVVEFSTKFCVGTLTDEKKQ